MIEAIGHVTPFSDLGNIGRTSDIDSVQTQKQINTIRDLVEALVFQISGGLVSPNGLRVQLQRLAELISHWGLGHRPEIGELIAKLDSAIADQVQTELRLEPTLAKLEELQAAFQLSPARISASIEMILMHHTEMLARAESGTLTQDAVLKSATVAAAVAWHTHVPIDAANAPMSVSGHRDRPSAASVDCII